MQFRRIQTKQVDSYKSSKPLVSPRFAIFGKLLTKQEPIYSEKLSSIPIKPNTFVKHYNHNISNETKRLLPISPISESPFNKEPLLETRKKSTSTSNISDKQKHTPNNYDFVVPLQSPYEPSVTISLSKNADVSHRTLPVTVKNTGNGMKMSLKPSSFIVKTSSRVSQNYRALSRNDNYSSSEKSIPPSIIGTKKRKKVSFAKTNDTSSALTTNCQEQAKVHIHRYLRLVSLFSDTNKSGQHFNDPMRLLQLDIDPIDMFTDPNKCIQFLKEKCNETIFLVTSNDLCQSIIHQIHHLHQVDTIYILGKIKRKDKRWIETWVKIKSTYSSIPAMCKIIEHDRQRHRRDSMAISMSSVELDRPDVSFMYTRLLTEILLEMGYDDRATKVFSQFYRRHLKMERSCDFKIIDEFEQEYDADNSIWWYTRAGFVSDMINEALRKQDIDTIIKAGFFIRDLQKQVETLYKPPTEKLIVYRGQGLSEIDFEQLRLRQSGLYCFNSFLSTTTDYNVAYLFAESNQQKPDQIGVLFQIEIDPNIFTPTQWAAIASKSYFCEESEFLFAMHSIFRIGEIKRIKSRLWRVQLSLTSDGDPELKKATEFIREITQGSSGWDRLAKFLLKLGKFRKAEEIFQMLINNTSENDADSRGHYYHMLGLVYEQGKSDYINALHCYKKALNIYLQYPELNRLDIIWIHNNIGVIYIYEEKYSEALEHFQMALNIQKTICCTYDVALTETYNNMAGTYRCLEQYSEALEFYQRVLSIQKKSVPANDINMSATYTNIAKIYSRMGEYQKALKLFRKVSRIHQYNPSSDKINTAITDNNIGQVYAARKEYTVALSYYEKALDVLLQFNSPNVAELTNTYDNLARVYTNMNENMQALEFYKRVAYNLEKHPYLKLTNTNLGIVRDSMGQIYKSMQQNHKAVASYRSAIQFEKNKISPNHFRLQIYRKHLAEVITE